MDKVKNDLIAGVQGFMLGIAQHGKPFVLCVLFVFANRFGGLLFDLVHKKMQSFSIVKKYFPVNERL